MACELLDQLSARKDTFSDNPTSVEPEMNELVDVVRCGKMTGVCIVVRRVNVAHTRISWDVGQNLDGHFTLDNFPKVDIGKRVGSAGGIRR